MTSLDLIARNFRLANLGEQPFTWCVVCQATRWFRWWVAPALGITVTTCLVCQSVPKNEEKYVACFAEKQKQGAA